MVLDQEIYSLAISELKLLNEKDHTDPAALDKYAMIYEQALINRDKLCGRCLELEELDLPYDCLSKPNYCAKNESDSEIIRLYEELRAQGEY